MAGKVIDPNSIANVYLFYGEEAFKRRNYKSMLKRCIADESSMNYAYFEGRDIDFNAVYDSVVTMPFFADRRLVIVENSGKFKAAKKAAAEEAEEGEGKAAPVPEKEEKADALIEKILADLPSTTCLAFFEEEANKTKKIFKTIASKGVACQCAPDDKNTLVMWLAKGFNASKKKIRKSTIELIIDRAGTDYDRLRTEFEKVIAYAGDRDEITDDDVYAVTSEDIEARIFDMLDAMCARNKALVLEKYYSLTVNNAHPLYLLAMIRIQFRTLLHVAELDAEGMNKYDIAKRLKKKDFIVERSLRNIRHFSAEKLEMILEQIADTDMKSKRGLVDPQVGVEMMLTQFTE